MVHTLSLLETSPYTSSCFICNLCWERGCGPVYHCSDCDFDIHVACAADSKQQTHFSHYQHPLYLCHCSTSHTCDSCGEGIHKLAFRCETCNFDMHSLCVRAPRFIKHPTHSHPLALTQSSEHPGLCDACNKVTTNLSYQCRSCNYSLHQFCATLPLRIKHSWHPQHMLRLLCKPPKEEVTFTCDKCGEQGRAWHFHCKFCRFSIHPHCMNISHELPHPNLDSSMHERSDATSSLVSSVVHNVSGVRTPSDYDLEAAERVLRFAREMVKGPGSWV